MKMKPLVLLVDPDAEARASQYATLDGEGYLVATEHDVERALATVVRRKPDVVVASVRALEGGRGDLARRVKAASPGTRFVLTAPGPVVDPAGRSLPDAVREEIRTRNECLGETP